MGAREREKIIRLFEKSKVSFNHITHDHVHTSEDAARVRGNSVRQALKAIVLRVKGYEKDYVLCCLPGDKKIDFTKVKKVLGVRDCSLASPKQVFEVTGCKVGTVPPIGSVLGLDTFIDESVFFVGEVFFSCATHHDSIKTKPESLQKVFDFKIIHLV